MILLALCALGVALLVAVVWRGWPTITFGDMAERTDATEATGIVIDPHRWDDSDEWEDDRA